MRIAYVSHVSSRWIKQRPHFITEALGRQPQVDIAFFDSFLVKRARLVDGQQLSVPVRHLPLLPQRLRRRLWFLDPVFSWVSAVLLFVMWRPSVVVVTHARHLQLARLLRRARVRVVYDCMDLNREFADSTLGDRQAERALMAIAEVVWCSSEAIAADVRAVVPTAVTAVVRNALDRTGAERSLAAPDQVDEHVVRYIGTVSEWFRFDIALGVLATDPGVSIELVGPTDVAVPEHPRLRAVGPRPHTEVLALMATSDVLVMPFAITPLVLGVDPVKLYEYIVSGRPVVCSDYPELEHFGTHVRRSNDLDEFVDAVVGALGTPRRPAGELQSFLEENNWDARARQAVGAL